MIINFDTVKAQVHKCLKAELPDNLFYHGIHHTFDDVLPAAERLGQLAKLNTDDMLLLQTAAAYHDMGYIERYENNEIIAARMVSEELPQFGYSQTQIDLIKQIILVTNFANTPKTLLEKLMRDADLDSLGRDDFFVISHSLRLELMRHGTVIPVYDWYIRQMNFLESHKYLTDTARTLRSDGQAANLRELQTILPSTK